ncbi:uncharacterized protein LOC143222400 [Tachypleus tridentatus]|uniref:uncharacterized protein LOC143222400 n=1 Tax=Tachypleus tridentatus TaxID=6853 RepID=UPI003FD46451
MERLRFQNFVPCSASLHCLPDFGWSPLWNPATLTLPRVFQPNTTSDLIVGSLKDGLLPQTQNHPPLSRPAPFRKVITENNSQTLNISGTTSSSLSSNDVTDDPLMTLKALEDDPFITRALFSRLPRRPRSEKKPIPTNLKDEKYFERRKRNNLAAKKSRDTRKARENEIAFRACFLEKENAILRAQVATLREEAHSLRHLLLQKRHRLC